MSTKIKVNNDEIRNVAEFEHIGSIINNGNCKSEVRRKLKAPILKRAHLSNKDSIRKQK